jgi:hypothetical protein
MLTVEDVRRISLDAYGDAGASLVDLWTLYNALFFGDELRPILITRTRVFRYGACIGMTTVCDGRHIQVKAFKPEIDAQQRAILLHEMLHQSLHQRGLSPKHAQEPWCAEVRRISALLGKPVWAGKYTVRKVDGKSVRTNQPPPADAAPVLVMSQCQIAGWPDSIGLAPPELRDYSQLEVAPKLRLLASGSSSEDAAKTARTPSPPAAARPQAV